MSNATPHSSDDIQERAALYVVGALEEDERAAFEAHLEGGCAQCRGEVDAYQAVTLDLAAGVATAPPRGLRQRVLAAAASQVAFSSGPIFEPTGFRFVQTGDLEWHSIRAGLDVKQLSVDEERGRLTQLIRMAAGVRIRAHRHKDIEESYILSGELIIDGVRMNAGDYCLAKPESVHEEIRTETGCTFLAISSRRDEYRE